MGRVLGRPGPVLSCPWPPCCPVVRRPGPVLSCPHVLMGRVCTCWFAQRAARGHRNVVAYMDHMMTTNKDGVAEAYILMEYCSGPCWLTNNGLTRFQSFSLTQPSRCCSTTFMRVGGRVVDMMSATGQKRLNAVTVMRIFCNVLEAVAFLHSLKPPIAHRDIKVGTNTRPNTTPVHTPTDPLDLSSRPQVENVMLCANGEHSGQFKLCDFGSATRKHVDMAQVPLQALAAISEEIEQNTTLSYRAPEQVDLYRRQPVDERVDVWVRHSDRHRVARSVRTQC